MKYYWQKKVIPSISISSTTNAKWHLDEDIIRKHLRHLDIEEDKLQFI